MRTKGKVRRATPFRAADVLREVSGQSQLLSAQSERFEGDLRRLSRQSASSVLGRVESARVTDVFAGDPLRASTRPSHPRTFLQAAHDRVAEAGQEVVRLGKRKDVVTDAAGVPVPLDQKSFLAALDVARQRAVRKAELRDRPGRFHHVHDPPGVEPPHAEGTPHHCHDRTGLYRSVRRPRLDPAQSELLPAAQGGTCRTKYEFSFAQLNPGVIHVITNGGVVAVAPTAE